MTSNLSIPNVFDMHMVDLPRVAHEPKHLYYPPPTPTHT